MLTIKSHPPGELTRLLNEAADKADWPRVRALADELIIELKLPNSHIATYFLEPERGRLTALYQKMADWGVWHHALELLTIACHHDYVISNAFAVEEQLRCFQELKIEERHPLLPRKAVGGVGWSSTHRHAPRFNNIAPRHIVICGVSYCGSTLLDIIMGCLPNVANFGESHWLVDPKHQSVDQANALEFESCSRCGPECEVLTKDLRARLARGTGDFYKELASFGSNETVVTSDKSYHILLRLDPALSHDAIVLFRHPNAMWLSHANRTGDASEVAQATYFRRWSAAYRGFVHNYSPGGRKIFVDFETFSDDPAKGLAEICDQLSLVFDASALRYWQTTRHFIAGNYNFRERLATSDARALAIKSKAKITKFIPHRDARHEHKRAVKIWQDLRERTNTVTRS